MTRITEPTTLITDYLLGMAGFLFAYKLYTITQFQEASGLLLWVITFILLALAAFIGGTYHGFRIALGEKTSNNLWRITVYTVACTSVALLIAGAYSTTEGLWQIIIISIALLKFVVVLLTLAHSDQFRLVIYDYASSMLMLILLYALLAPTAVAVWMIGGILVSFFASAIQLLKISPSEHFNHNDLYHVIQIVALYLMYTAVSIQFLI